MNEDAAATLVGLVKHYSPSGQEAGAVHWLVERMQALGFDRSFADPAGNAVGVLGDGPRQIALVGHIDTVPGEIEVSLTGDVLYGRGAVDAKGPLAAFVDAVAQTGKVEGWQFIVVGAVDEERDSLGARFVADQYQPELAIFGEPGGWSRVALGYKGSAWAEISTRCSVSHSASGQANACETAAALWNSLCAWADDFNAGRERLFDRVLLSLQAMHSWQDGFTQNAQLQIMARLPVDLPPANWYAQLSNLAGAAQVKPSGFAIPAYLGGKNTPLVRAFLAAIRAQAGTPGFVLKTGTSDMNILAPTWNCPSLVYGPGDSALDHTPNEHIALSEYSQSVAVLADVLRRLTLPG